MLIQPTKFVPNKFGSFAEFIEPIDPEEIDEILERLSWLAGADLAKGGQAATWAATRYSRLALPHCPLSEDDRDPAAPDEDDDTVGADWDEMGYWDLEGEDDEGEWDEA